jgi:hypothetical protein
MITPDDFCKWSSSNEEKRKPIIDEVVLEEYITQCGFRCMYDDFKLNDIRMVRVKDFRVSNSSTNMLYHFLKTDISKSHKEWLQPLKAYRVLLFAPAIIQMNRIEPNLLRDTANKSYIPFNNGIVEITKSGVALKSYGEVLSKKTCLLEDKIIQRDVDLSKSDYENGSWYKFCKNAVGVEGLPALMSAIGYMLHTYKDKSKASMIMFSDSANDDDLNANGGSGKSLIAYYGLREIRNTHWEDGKSFDPGSTFKFQGLTPAHEITIIDDIKKRFNQEVLYNMITGEFSLQVKYKTATRIDFENSCKFIITGNFGISLNGDSDKRRSCIIGFTDHYNKSNTPIKEFGHRFFDDWVDDLAVEYQYFYNFMFACIKLFLNKGISDYNYDSVIKKGVTNTYPKNLLDAIDRMKDRTIGIDNAMKMKYWYDFIGVNNEKSVEAFRKVMELDGYMMKEVNKRLGGVPSKLYYWVKK